MKSIRDYATEHGCTPANIYNHIKAHKDDLDGHVIKHGSKKFLDDFAQEYLDLLITPKTVTVNVPDQKLMDEINRLRAALSAEQSKSTAILQEKLKIEAELTEMRSKALLLEEKTSTLQDDLKHSTEEKEALSNEVSSFKRLLGKVYIKASK